MNKIFKKYSNKKIAIFLVVFAFSWMNLLYAQSDTLSYLEDQDGDGLSDDEEIVLETDPTNPDTDGDGYSDGVEVSGGYDPLIPAPGDRIMDETTMVEGETTNNESINLTETLIQNLEEKEADALEVLQTSAETGEELADVIEQEEEDGNEVSLTESELQDVIEESLEEAGVSDDEMELISEDEITILPIPEGDDPEEVIELEKKQVEEYFVQIAYILTEDFGYLSGNQDELLNEALGLITELSTDIDEGDDSTTGELKEEGEEMYDKIREVEVPYVLKDVHVLGLSLSQYLLQQDESVVFEGDDPAGLSLLIGKLEGSMMGFDELNEQVTGILDEYDIETFDVSGYLN